MKKGWLVTWCLVLSFSAFGQTAATKTGTKEVPATVSFTHLEGRFRQVRESSMLSSAQVETGLFVYDAPNRVEWKYDSGSAATLPAPVLRFIGGAVNGSLQEETDDFEVSRQQNELVLTPKKQKMRKVFDRIEIRLDARGIAEEVMMHEPTGDMTHITFSEMTYR
ncbi:MAG: outer membrane lipoprotein carrier protein LolA [Paludibacteraceae bacterium]|nr:outer membrane lipoprotein carrier protein LolA [Paludibacteraceae bacterium]